MITLFLLLNPSTGIERRGKRVREFCPHLDLPMVYAGCAICKGVSAQTRPYNWGKHEVVLYPKTNADLYGPVAVWRPSTKEPCPKAARILHISGNWAYKHFLMATKVEGIMALQFAPSQKFMLSSSITSVAKERGIGIILRTLRGPK